LDRAACPRGLGQVHVARHGADGLALVEDRADHAGLEVTSQSRAVRPDDDPTRECAAAASAPERRTRAVSEEGSAAQGQHARVPARARDAQGRARNPSQAAARGTARLATHVLLAPLVRGAPARAVQKLAGHRDLGTTQLYMHLSPLAIEAAIRLLELPPSAAERGNMWATPEAGEEVSGTKEKVRW
jgi:hypothetical protein